VATAARSRLAPSWRAASRVGLPSVIGTPLDASNVRKALNHMLDKAELHRRGPHQMRDTFASLLLQSGAATTYVSRQLGHKDSAITLKAHWLPESTASKIVDWLDDARPSATPAQPARKIAVGENPLSHYGAMVSRVGIEPTTRRLRVGPRRKKSQKSE
jgi:Phage integrase family